MYSRLHLIEPPWKWSEVTLITKCALLAKVNYVTLQIRTAKSGSIKRRELLTGEILTKVNGILQNLYSSRFYYVYFNRFRALLENFDDLISV